MRKGKARASSDDCAQARRRAACIAAIERSKEAQRAPAGHGIVDENDYLRGHAQAEALDLRCEYFWQTIRGRLFSERLAKSRDQQE